VTARITASLIKSKLPSPSVIRAESVEYNTRDVV
jgi:hypothetical protein